MLWLVLGIVGSVLQSMSGSGEFLSLLGSLLQTSESMPSTLFVVIGVMNLADRLGNAPVRAKGMRVIKMTVAVYVIALILKVITLVAGKSDTAVVSGGILGIIALILMLAAYIIYLPMLSAGKKMLAH